MKKKLFVLLTTVTLISAGCSDSKENSTDATTAAPASEIVTEAPTEAPPAKDKSLKGLAEYLVAGSYVSGEQTETMYTYIGAIGGFKYLDSNVEVYEYDEASDTYKSIVETNEVSGLKVYAINGPYILIFSNDTPNQSVIDAFNAY